MQRNLTALTNDLYPAEVFPFLTQESILTENDMDVINAETTRRQQAFLLVTTLYRKGPKAFSVFVEALKDSHQH
uniref:CARD domain-containing protein n=1 Tax=Capitella teleta TaxID=283909 RepID=X2B7S8_CAPTE